MHGNLSNSLIIQIPTTTDATDTTDTAIDATDAVSRKPENVFDVGVVEN